jgi:hypothetical protein
MSEGCKVLLGGATDASNEVVKVVKRHRMVPTTGIHNKHAVEFTASQDTWQLKGKDTSFPYVTT